MALENETKNQRRTRRWVSSWLARPGAAGGLLAATLWVLGLLLTALVMLVFVLSLVVTHRLPWQIKDSNEHLADIVKLAFAALAGLGGAVALVVAYRRQRDIEINRFTEQFGVAASQLGGTTAAVRLAGAYAMAALADEWTTRRQPCIDVLCAYLRLPYSGNPDDAQLMTVTSEHSWSETSDNQAQAKEQRIFQFQPNDREVRHTIIRIIRDHLRDRVKVGWQDRDFDFTGAMFDGSVNFKSVRFSGATVSFSGARFSGDTVDFGGAEFSGDTVDFSGAKFSADHVSFSAATFSGGTVDFSAATFSGGTVDFSAAMFSGGDTVIFRGAKFSGDTVNFGKAEFSRPFVSFVGAEFSVDTVNFMYARFSGGTVNFNAAEFPGGSVSFFEAKFSGSTVYTSSAKFSGNEVGFFGAEFSGGSVYFRQAEFSGDKVDFSHARFSGGSVYFGGEKLADDIVNFNTNFGDARFSGGPVTFREAEFSGGTVTFARDPIDNGTVGFNAEQLAAGVITVDGRPLRTVASPPQ